ncbi:hypothetical protein P7K49_004336 [Saguinus oedipus]|uniref:Uncharacterized protein n=1 Tax=Saguinus oedipus TaxID=9490 RepID=A0ABQ9W7P8_SAGOE|nr:hypothetical protein P7K49_004336 [Saguinus oedipus]
MGLRWEPELPVWLRVELGASIGPWPGAFSRWTPTLTCHLTVRAPDAPPCCPQCSPPPAPVFFFSTVASAVAGLLCVVTILLYILIQYFVNPWVLRTDPKYEGMWLPLMAGPLPGLR